MQSQAFLSPLAWGMLSGASAPRAKGIVGGPRTGPPVAPSLDLPPLPPSRAGPAGPDPEYAIIVAVKATDISKPGALATAMSWMSVAETLAWNEYFLFPPLSRNAAQIRDS